MPQGQTVQLLHQRDVVRQRFAKAKAHVQHQPLGGDARRKASRRPRIQILRHLRRDVAVLRIVLHVFRQPFHVHQTHARPRLRHNLHRARILQALHIVDDVRPAAFQRRPHHAGAARVQANRHIPTRQLRQNRLHALPFRLGRHIIRIRARGFAANVQNIRPVFKQLLGVL